MWVTVPPTCISPSKDLAVRFEGVKNTRNMGGEGELGFTSKRLYQNKNTTNKLNNEEIKTQRFLSWFA